MGSYENHLAASRNWKRAHREQNNAIKRADYYRHKEQRKSKMAAYYRANRERMLAQMKADRIARPEVHRARSKAYYQKHRKRIDAQAAQWRKDHPEAVTAINVRRYARDRGAAGSHTAQEWREKIELFGGCCVYCGRSDRPLNRDHDVPLVRGGSNYISNILPSCKPCNSRKRDRTAREYLSLRAA